MRKIHTKHVKIAANVSETIMFVRTIQTRPNRKDSRT